MSDASISTCSGGRRLISVSAKGKRLVVDLHCHLSVPAADALVRSAMPGGPPPLPFTSLASNQVNARMFAEVGARLSGVDQRLTDMDRLGVDVQAISPSPGQYFYFTEPELGLQASRMVNNGIAEAVARHPDRLVGMGSIPMQVPELAVVEMRRCVKELDLRGIEISSNVNGEELSDPKFRAVFSAAEELGLLLFLHPLGFTQGQRLTEHYFNNIIGNPLDATIALGHLIFGGVLDAHPDLKLCVAHGGGYLPAYWGRMDHAWRVRPDCHEHIPLRAPSSYLRNVWLDTLVFDPAELDALVASHGADKLCMGTDYPFDMSEPDPVGFHAHLNDAVQDKIMGANAAALLGLARRQA